MIRSVRFEASSDSPGLVKDLFDAAFRRLGLGAPSQVTDEVYERNKDGFYDGRVKVVFDVPMPSDEELLWFKQAEEAPESPWDILRPTSDVPPYFALSAMPGGTMSSGGNESNVTMTVTSNAEARNPGSGKRSVTVFVQGQHISLAVKKSVSVLDLKRLAHVRRTNRSQEAEKADAMDLRDATGKLIASEYDGKLFDGDLETPFYLDPSAGTGG